MQQIIKEIVCFLYENGLCDVAYFSIQIAALLISLILSVHFGKKFGLSIGNAAFAIVTEVAIVYIEMAIICKIVNYFVPDHIPVMNTYYNNVGRTFVLVPISAWLTSKVIKTDLRKLCNIFAFAQPIIWGLASLACLFSGCCEGISCQWGIYNAWKQDYLFPTQLLNAILLVGVGIYIAYRAKKNNYQSNGTEYPIALILIGTVRFSTEFLMDNPKIVYGLSSLSFDSIVMCVMGIAALAVLKIKSISMRVRR